jgi:hypothetical protein
MSALGHSLRSRPSPAPTVVHFGPITDKRRRSWIVRFVPKGDIAPTESGVTRSVMSPLNNFRTFAVSTRGTWTIEHDAAGGAELPSVLDKTEGYATRIRDSVLAKPKRIRCAGICILLRICDCGERSHDHGEEGNGAQFTHDVALQFRYRSNNDWGGKMFLTRTGAEASLDPKRVIRCRSIQPLDWHLSVVSPIVDKRWRR